MSYSSWFGARFILIVVVLLAGYSSVGQVTVKGTVYDVSKTRPLEGVSVMSTSGKGTVTNNLGNYSIELSEKDSIYFSYLAKPTQRFAVSTIPRFGNFDISIHVPSNILPEVVVKPPDYKMDSIQNRLDYAKAFNFRKPGLGITSSSAGGAGVGLDLDQLINVFNFRKNRSMMSFQRRLEQEEQDKFIDHRFSRVLVRKITGLSGGELDRFMKAFRPNFEFTQLANEYEFAYYIKQCYLKYKAVFGGR